MKRLFTFLCLIALTCPLLGQENLRQAEDLYRQGKFAAALKSYEEILKNHPKDPFVYYNIGNCYFKMGSKGLAAANYYRAYRLAPRDEDIRHNLALSLAAGQAELVPAGVPAVLYHLFFYFSYTELTGLMYALWWLIGGLILFAVLRRRWNRFLTGAVVVLCVVSGWWYARRSIEQEPLAVIASPLAEVRSGPGKNFPASASAAQGHLLSIQDEKDAWYQVILKSQGIKGWIEKQTVEKI